MSLSLNEVEATAKKATRGAGYPWGLAEEAARATRWLCSQNIDGCAALASLLGQVDGRMLDLFSPRIADDVWEAESGTLCPVVTGAALSDRAHTLHSQDIQLGSVHQPILLVPFAGLCAQQLDRTVTVAWTGTRATTDGQQLCLIGSPRNHAVGVTVGEGGEIGSTQPRCSRAEPDLAALAVLNRFASRTYAPATEQSRLMGAGAGVSDND
jgi:hypothetical protein